MFKEKFNNFFHIGKKAAQPITEQKDNKMVVLQSNGLGFSVVEQQTDQNTLLTNQQWQTILKNQNFNGFPHGRIYYNFLKGIPNDLRLRIWLMMSCPKILQASAQQQYLKYLKVNLSQVEQHQIAVDLKRTYGNLLDYQWTSHILKRILSAASVYKHSYTQGMNYILIYVLIFSMEAEGISKLEESTTQFESRVLAVFVGILDKMERIFGHNLQKFMDVMKQLEELLTDTLPELLFNIAGMGFDVLSLFSQNYFSLMMYVSPPFQMAKMILDLFQLEGHKSIHAILVRMLELCSEELLAEKQPEIFQKIIKTDIFNICGQRFIKQKQTAKSIEDFGLSIFEKTEFS